MSVKQILREFPFVDSSLYMKELNGSTVINGTVSRFSYEALYLPMEEIKERRPNGILIQSNVSVYRNNGDDLFAESGAWLHVSEEMKVVGDVLLRAFGDLIDPEGEYIKELGYLVYVKSQSCGEWHRRKGERKSTMRLKCKLINFTLFKMPKGKPFAQILERYRQEKMSHA